MPQETSLGVCARYREQININPIVDHVSFLLSEEGESGNAFVTVADTYRGHFDIKTNRDDTINISIIVISTVSILFTEL